MAACNGEAAEGEVIKWADVANRLGGGKEWV